MTSKSVSEEEIVWNTASELQLLQVLVQHKPAGINKHFQMVIIQDKLSQVIPGITCQHIWAKLRTMYDLAAVDDREEHIPFNLEKKEFCLPKREFSGIMREVRQDERDRPSQMITTKAPRTSNSSRSLPTKNVSELSRTKTTSTLEASRLKTSGVSEPSKQKTNSLSESPRPKTINASEQSKLSISLESPAEMAKKINASKEKEKEVLKTLKPNEAAKASTDKFVTKSEDLLKGAAKRSERATRSTPTPTPAKRRKT